MKFESTDPDLSQWGPGYSNVVSPRQCYYYLSFLEKFVELTKDMAFNELRIFMACAEYRYFKFMHQESYNVYNKVPSIDTAFFKQVYLLYLAHDNQNEGRLKHYPSQTRLNLDEIRKEACNIDGDYYWKKQMGDNLPYQFTKDNFKQAYDTSFAEVICIVCFALNKVNWKAFADWRYDHTVAIQCHTCDTMLTIHHFGKANLIHDLDTKKSIIASEEYSEIIQLLSTDKAVQRLPFNSGLEGIQCFLSEKLNQEEHNINGFIGKIKSTYFCSPYPAAPLDLIRAVADFYAFAYKVTQTIDWKLPDDYWKCVHQYHHFANLIFETETPNMTPIPNIRIDLARYLHMLYPADYSWNRIWNRVIDIPKDMAKAKQLAEITSCEWNLYFAKHKQNAAVVSLMKGIEKMSWREDMFRNVLQPGKYIDYAMEETSVSYEDGHKGFNHFNQLISYMIEKRSIRHITDDANYSIVYQSNDAKASDERSNITKKHDFDWLVPNTSWTDTLKPYRQYPQYRYKIFQDRGTIGGYFAEKNMPSDAVKKLYYHHPRHHPPMTFEYYSSSEGGGGGA